VFISREAYQEAIQQLLDHNEAQDELLQAKDAQIEALVTALKKLQWSSRDSIGFRRCPDCLARKGDEQGHYDDCELAAAIKEAADE